MNLPNNLRVSKPIVASILLSALFIFTAILSQSSNSVKLGSDTTNASTSNSNYAQDLVASTLDKYPEAQEITEKRERNSKTYLIETLPDGTKKYAFDSSISPVHFTNAQGSWEEINTNLIPVEGDWDYAMEKADYSFYAKETLNADKLIEFKKDGEYINFAPISLSHLDNSGEEKIISAPMNVIGEVNGDTISWQGAFGEGTELSWTALPERLAKILKVNSLEDIGISAEDEGLVNLKLVFDYSDGVGIFVDGESWDGSSLETRESVEFRSKAGEKIWEFRKPTAWDSNGVFANDNYFSLKRVGDKAFVTHSIPIDWLKSAANPVYIDVDLCPGGPGGSCVVSASGDDAQMSEPSTFDSTNWFGIVGYSGTPFHSFSRFTGLSGLGGSTIDVAYYSVYNNSGAIGLAKTRVTAEKSASPTAPTSVPDFLGRPETVGVSWDIDAATAPTDVYIDSPPLVAAITEVASYDPTDILILHKDNGSSTTGSNYVVYREFDVVSGIQAPRLHVEYTAGALDPDFLITKSRLPADTTPAVDIIADFHAPTSTFGSRTFQTTDSVRLHGWVRNLTGPAGNVELCFYEENQGAGGPSAPCDVGPITIEVPPAGWQGSLGGMPFGTACGDHDGDGEVTANDYDLALTNYPDPLYDITDDGITDVFGDLVGVIDQIGIFCDRSLSITASSTAGLYEAWAQVDVDQAYVEGNEGNNNAGPDEYEVIVDPIRNLGHVDESRITLEPGNYQNDEFTALLTAGIIDPGWNLGSTKFTATIDDTNLSDPSIIVSFGTKGDTPNQSIVIDPVGSGNGVTQVLIQYFVEVPTGVATGLGTFKINMTAEQEGPNFSTTDFLKVEVAVVEKTAWFQTVDGDVAAQGQLTDSSVTLVDGQLLGEGTLGYMQHNIICWNVLPPADSTCPPGVNHDFPNFWSFQMSPAITGTNCAGSVTYHHRTFLLFNTSFLTEGDQINSATLSFEIANFGGPPANLQVGIYQDNNIEWTFADLGSEPIANNLWHEVNKYIAFADPVPTPDDTFNTSGPEFIGKGQGDRVEIDLSGVLVGNKQFGNETQLILKVRDETSLPVCPSGKSFKFKNPELSVDYVGAAHVNATYLGIADEAITGFVSAAEWLVRDYGPPPPGTGLNYTFGTDGIYGDLWDEFGSAAIDYGTDNNLPVSGVNAYPSRAAVTTGGITNFNWDGTGSLGGNEPAVLFISGNLNIKSDLNLGDKKVVFIVKNDVNVSSQGVSAGLTSTLDSTSECIPTSATSFTWQHTTSGSNRALVVGVSINNGATGDVVSGVTYAGEALAYIGSVEEGSSLSVRAELWGKVNPAFGINDVVVNTTVGNHTACGASSWTGVNQSTPWGNFITAAGRGSNMSVDVASSIGEVVVDVVSARINGDPVVVDPSQNELWNNFTGAGAPGILASGGGSSEPGAPSVNMSWTNSLSTPPWAIVAVPLIPVGVPPLNTIEGFFVSAGEFNSGDNLVNPTVSAPNNVLTVNGGIVAQGGFDLGRDLGDENSNAPAELFIFDPSYLYLFARVDPTATRSLLGESGTVARELPP